MFTYTALQDPDLFDLLKSDDETAFKEIYKRYFDVLYNHAYKKLNSLEEAQDIVQEIFTNFWERRRQIVLTGSLAAYLFTAVRNRVINVIAHKQIKSCYIQSLQQFIDHGECHTDHKIRESQLTFLIEKEIASLPPKMQQVFELSRKRYLSHKEIAAELNISEQTVKKQISNALKLFKARMWLSVILIIYQLQQFF